MILPLYKHGSPADHDISLVLFILFPDLNLMNAQSKQQRFTLSSLDMYPPDSPFLTRHADPMSTTNNDLYSSS